MKIFYSRLLLIFVLFSVSISSGWAQTPAPVTYNHFTYWSRITVAKVFAKKWETAIEYQHRRQNYTTDDLNLLKYPLLHSFRIRTRYAVNNQLTFSLIPFTYFYATPLLGTENDLRRKPDKEFRFAIQGELRQKIGKVDIFNRVGYEKRLINRPPDSLYRSINRFRTRILLEIPLLNKQKQEILRPYFSSEVFLNVGKSVLPTQIFEHFRFLTGVRIPIHTNLRLDTGYQYSFRVRRTGYEKDLEHTLFTYLTFQL